eukprot:5957435-Prymnesium_polylepis.1
MRGNPLDKLYMFADLRETLRCHCGSPNSDHYWLVTVSWGDRTRLLCSELSAADEQMARSCFGKMRSHLLTRHNHPLGLGDRVTTPRGTPIRRTSPPVSYTHLRAHETLMNL